MNSSVNAAVADTKTLKVARWRFYSVALVMAAATLALIWHVASLQVLPDTDKGYEFLQNQGQSRTLRTESITAYRGVITDRNGEPLAVSTPVASLWANPKVLLQAPQRWAELSQALGWNKAELESRLARYSSREFMYLQRHLPPQAAETILALDIPGVYSQTEYRRYYPAGDVTAHLVGMTDIDDRGQEGMELAYDAWLSGENGAKEVLKDLHGRTVKELQLIKSARSGQGLTLSIDLRLQYLAHRELKNAVEQSGALAGSLVILDVVTGEVLAMANQPSYNPNDRNNAKGSALRNRAITDVYEPGSTMKPIAVMAALESGKFKPNDVINTSPGYIQVGSKTLKDLHNYGPLDLSMVIAKSSQVGMTKLALELEPHIIRDMYARLGIGQTTGTGFPGEGSGLLPAHARWRPIQRATLAYGYGMNVTVLQLAQAYSVIASGGVKRPVSLLRVDNEPAAERVVAEHYTQDIITMLKRAATEGTATRARAISYTVAGKTGTVHKVGAHGYEEKRYMSSFAGMAPADNPRIVAVVVIDEPDASRYFGGLVAAPVFSKVAEGALRMMQIPPQPLVPPNMAAQPKKEEQTPGEAGDVMALESQSFALTLAQLLPEMNLAKAAPLVVSGLTLDTRQLTQGDVFIALSGKQFDGRHFIASAIERGAVAVLVEADKEWQGIDWLGQVPVIAVDNLAQQVSAIAGRFYGEPSAHFRLVGITGTNGKTTCSLLLGQLSALLQERAGVVGTVGYGVLDAAVLAPFAQQLNALTATGLTTPDAVRLQHILAQLREHAVTAVAIEVSSHSLQQGRVAGLHFETAIFTNLTQDHLDYHGDLVSYGKAKQQLLQMPGLRYAIVNADDSWAKSLLEKMPSGVQPYSFSLRDTDADVYAKDIALTATGASVALVTPWGVGEFHSHLMGAFNLSNLLAVITAACVGGAALADVLLAIPQLQPAPGRMQAVTLEQSQQDINVIVDYAHTPDALENTLTAIREHNPGRVWTVFGCGGDRDRSKRPLMGRIAERLSDYVIVTNDNPRTEDPAVIAADILRGMHNTHGCLVIAERGQAIDLAIQQAKAGDVVLIAGKGHEDYQIFATQTLPFSDVKQARLALQRRIARRDADTEIKS